MNTSTAEEIRRKVRKHLRQLPLAKRRQLTDLAIENFVQTAEFRRCNHIGLYFPVRHELDILPLLDICRSRNKQVYLPCLYPKPFQKLYFLPFDSKDTLRINRFAIPEPDHTFRKKISLFKLDMVIAPLLAFSGHGTRLGTGGGFYDRTFSYRLKPGILKRPGLWSIALEAQKYPLKSNPWDVPLDGISTELDNYRHDHDHSCHHHP